MLLVLLTFTNDTLRASAAAFLRNPTQTGLPMTALSVVGAQWRLKPQDRRLLWSQYMPWALRAGAAAPDLLCLHYERHFEVCDFPLSV